MRDHSKLAGLSPKKRALYEMLLKEQQQKLGKILPRQREQSSLPLSFAQQRLWFLDQLEQGSAAYNMTFSLPIMGSVDSEILRRSIVEVMRRHEILRTTFAVVDQQPSQIVASEPLVDLAVIDLRSMPAEQRESAARRFSAEEAQRPFDLEAGPLLRTVVLTLDDEQSLVLMTVHHIVCDSWSAGLLIKELEHIYTAFAAGRASTLPELPIQYADYALWQRQWLQGPTLEAQLGYWTRQLGGALPVLALPTDHPRPPIQSYNGNTRSQILPLDLTVELKALSRRAGATLFMTMLAATQTLLYRYSAQSDLLLGSPIAGRNRQEIENLIGFFVNTVVLRTDLSGNPTFMELLGRVRTVAQEAYSHQDLPFEMLVEKLHPQRDLSRNPLFQVMFSLETMDDLTLRQAGSESGTSKFDLSLDIINTDQGLAAFWEYNTDLFEAATIVRMQAHFETLLQSIVATPDQRIDQLPMLTLAERQQIVLDWNNTEAVYPQGLCIHELFEAQVKRTPEAIALSCPESSTSSSGPQRLSYDALNRRANQLARHLQARGVRSGMRVGICVAQSPAMIIGVLAILKVGAAYVPLDPAYPKERLHFMIADAQAAVLLTQEHLLPVLPEHNAAVLCLDRLAQPLEEESDTDLPNAATHQHMAYMIYTSGSTGVPKGVMVPHAGVVNAYRGWEESYRLRTHTTAHLQMANFSFDVFSGDFVRALCSGGKLVLCPRELLLDPEQLYALMRREQVDCAEFVPAVLRNLVQYLERIDQSLDFMRVLIAGSDTWLGREYRQVQRLCGSETRLINSYGVSEASIDSCYFEASDTAIPANECVPIGRPFGNNRLYILDQHLEPLPVNIPGELFIGGPGVAQGYLNQPGLTAAKFIPDPYTAQPGARLYRTGDLACFLPDGNIKFLGRIDQEVKIRGFRIDLGEIEGTLSRHPAVQQCAVVVREEIAGDKRLAAYLILKPEQAGTPVALSDFLKTRLPSYMIPAAFVELSSFPLTPNGKVDRAAFPAPGQSHTVQTYVAPRTEVEQAIVRIWQALLGVERVGLSDHFFELGGHSLLAPQLVFRLQETFHVTFPLRRLFEAPTVAELAQTIEALRRGDEMAAMSSQPEIDLRAEVILDPLIQAPEQREACPTSPAAIFLTGATGFLGAYLLSVLLDRTSANVYALVRASSEDAGQFKIQRNLESYDLWHEQYRDRILAVSGDLTQPLLGLSSDDFNELAEQIDSIYHCAAWVNFTYPYQLLKAANVSGTHEVIRLAARSKLKPVHFISTLSVFPAQADGSGGAIAENAPLDQPIGLVNGYAESKWVAEQLMIEARARGLPMSMYRPGLIGGHSVTGKGNPRDLIWSLIKGCVQMGSAPEMDMLVDLAPVDYVSHAIAHLSLQPTMTGNAFHLLNSRPLSWSQVVDQIHAAGYPIRHIAYAQWRDELRVAVGRDPDHALAPFLSIFPEQEGQDPQAEAGYTPRFSDRNTQQGLEGTAITCPVVDSRLMQVYLTQLIRDGFLDPPVDSVNLFSSQH